jgi:glucan biosynthesis protein
MPSEGMNRRQFVLAAGSAAVGVVAKSPLALSQEAGTAFGRDSVVELARALATKEFRPPNEVPELFERLGYDQYRDIRFRAELGFWTGEDRGFSLDLLHAGFIYKAPVEVHVVEAGMSIPVRYTTHLFDFGPQELARVVETRSGLTLDHSRRVFVIDFAPPETESFGADVQPQVFASQGTIRNIVGQRNTLTDGYRVSFELDVNGVDVSELRLFLVRSNQLFSETWLYRWTR